MATLEKAPTSNFWSTSLNGAINDSVTTITLNSTTGLQAPGRLVINRQDSTGKNTPSAREVISFTGISGSDLTGVTRGADNSTARSHADGSLVESAIVVGNWDALYKVVNQEHSTSGVHSVADMVTGGSVIDDDTFATASATKLATSESIKAYANLMGNGVNRQAIINGNFDVWQRGTTVTLADVTNTFLADRWKEYANKDGGTLPTLTRTRQVLTSGDISNAFFYSRIAFNGAGSSLGVNSQHQYTQNIENGTRNLCGDGKKVTLSFWARSNVANKRLGIRFTQNYGTGGSPSSAETILTGSDPITLTSTWTKYTVTVTTNTLAGKTFGTAYDDIFQVSFFYMWGTTYGNTNIKASVTAETYVGAGYVDIAQVQLCAGEVALPFMPKSYEEELRACQRYMEFLSGAIGQAISATVATFGFSYKVTKRIAAGKTNVFFITGTNALEVNTSIRTFTTCDAAYPTVNGGSFDLGGASSMTPPNMVHLGSDKIYVDVEL